MVIGNPIQHSLSPKMHNTAFEALGIDNEFVFVASQVKSEDLSNFVKGVRTMGIRGVACTIPHKTEIIEYLDEVDEVAQIVGSVNTVVNNDGVLKGYNTDWLGVINPLEKITSLDNKTVALIGAGGVARAVAYAVTKRGAKLTIYNRSLEEAKKLAKEFGGKALSLHNLEKVKDADIIFNATPLGMYPNEDKTPIPNELIRKNQIVFDAVYTPFETKLLRDAKSIGAQIILGTEMFVEQGAAQFKLFTGKGAPKDDMRKVFLKHSQSFCLPIIKERKEEVLKTIEDNIQNFQYFEVWIDYVEDLDEDFIKSLTNKFKDKLIFLLRRRDLEKGKLSSDLKNKIIKLLEGSESILDLDIVDQKDELEFLKKNNSSIKRIVSYHNYKETPSLVGLQKMIKEMENFNPDIFKISTLCKNEEDSLKLLNLLLILKKQNEQALSNRNKKFIILGMGKAALITRIFGALWGNEFNFAPVDLKERSAEGQLTKGQLENILKEIN